MFRINKKTVFVLAVLATALCFVGCDSTSSSSASASGLNPTHSSSSPFVVINEWKEEVTFDGVLTNVNIHHAIMVHNETKVMYHSSTSIYIRSVSTTFDMLLDANGAPMIYDGQVPASNGGDGK